MTSGSINSLSEIKATNTIEPKNLLREKLKELAGLDSVDYQLVRKESAKALELGVTALDRLVKDLQKQEDKESSPDFEGWNVEPWTEQVDGGQLFEEIFNTFQAFVIADKESIEVAAMWTALTWLTDYATVLPMAMITAPEKGCGKTVFLSVIEKMACRPLQACNITQAALFRAVDKWEPSLLIDEADSFLGENEGLRGILNSGHTRSSAYVLRCVETDGAIVPVKFKTWGAKAISGIKLEQLHATLTSRSILLPLRRKKPTEQIENLRHADQDRFDTLKSKLYRWSIDNGEKFSKLRPELPELQNRDADNWEPLLAIAQLVSTEWFDRVKHAAIKICCKADESPSLEVELLSDIKSVFEKKSINRISSVNLIDELCSDELAPWSTYNRGFPLKPRQLARRLSAYNIHPKAIKISGQVFKGYLLSEFADVFERYVFSSATPQKSVTRLLCSDNGANSDINSVTDKQGLPFENELEPALTKEGNPVTDKTPLPEKEKENDEGVEF